METASEAVSCELVGGRLKNYLSFWKTITSDKSILDIISGANIEFERPVQQLYPCKQIQCSNASRLEIQKEIDKYLKLGIIEKADHSYGEFVSQIFSVPKRNGGLRIILNLKPLNCDIQYHHFKMENLNSVLNLINEHCFMASIDLKDAYYSVNIHESFRKYLRFLWNDQLFQFTCLPNGLTSAPRWYTNQFLPHYVTEVSFLFTTLMTLG